MPTNIDHVVVLMLENRSFDHLFGFLDHPDPRFERLTDQACPDDNGVAVKARTGARYEIASPDHSHAGIFEQLGIRGGRPYRPDNRGFVKNFARRSPGGQRVMHSFHPKMIPVLSTLAKEYALCTRWFSSVPGETWPNREFVHSGTSRGNADIVGTALESQAKTVFELLDDANQAWRVYHDRTPHSWCYSALWDTLAKRSRFQPMQKLYDAIRDDQLPAYAFVEPDYGRLETPIPGVNVQYGRGNSLHPHQASGRDEFVEGELLVHRIYDALRRKPAVFEKTVFVITFDEHGGFYDHVPPPVTTPPDTSAWSTGFSFDLLGVRVPTIIVSPWIPRGTLDDNVYDHTSIIQTLRNRFAPTRPALRERDKRALSFRGVLSLAAPRRGAALPVTRPLSLAEAVALESQLALPLPADEVPQAEGEDRFRDAMRALSAKVGARLAAESPLEGPGFDPDDPGQVLLQFRTSAEEAHHVLGPDARARLREAAMPGGPQPEGGFESIPLDGLEPPPVLETPAAPQALLAEKALAESVLHKLRVDAPLSLAEISGFEAIVMLDERPVLDIDGGAYATPPAPWEYLAREPARAHLARAIACVGRIDVPTLGGGIPYAGTGFLVGEGLLMTNRHVAAMFTTGVGTRGLARKAEHPRVELDLERERAARTPLVVTDVVLVHPYWDVALLRVTGAPPGRFLTLRATPPEQLVGRDVAAIGYPASDPARNNLVEQDRIFRSTYQIKRLSPGRITAPRREVALSWGTVDAMVHDCSTLGGNSGSCLVDVATGDVIGLHLGGRYLQANFACPAYELRRDPHVVAAGVRFTDDPVPAEPPAWLAAWGGAAAEPPARPDPQVATTAAASAVISVPSAGGPSTIRVRVPIELTITIGAPTSGED